MGWNGRGGGIGGVIYCQIGIVWLVGGGGGKLLMVFVVRCLVEAREGGRKEGVCVVRYDTWVGWFGVEGGLRCGRDGVGWVCRSNCCKLDAQV